MPFNQREPRTKQVACAVSDEEKTLITDWAQHLGESVSDFLREAIKDRIEHLTDANKPKRAQAR